MTYPVDPFGEPSEEGMGGVSARSEVGVGEHKAPQDQASEFEAYRTAEGARAAPPIAIEDADSLGSAFKAARFASGRSLAELSEITRVPTRYLTALEDGRLADLPSRPFALGHARAYAQALGLDETAAAERLRRDYDLPSQTLQPPVGVAFDEPRRISPLWAGGIAALVVAVVGWNVIQRVNLLDRPTPSDLAEIPESWRVGDVAAEFELDAPRPAPPDQTTPVLYVTPGLEDVLAPALAGAAAAASAPDSGGPVGAAFNPRGAIYGAAEGRSGVILQARRAANIVIRAQDGVVHFARQLAAGEAYRAPNAPGLVVDVSDPTAFDLFLNGERAGQLEASLTQLASLNNRAQQLAREAAAEADARNRAAQAAAEARLREQQASAPEPVAPPPSAPAESPPPEQPQVPVAG